LVANCEQLFCNLAFDEICRELVFHRLIQNLRVQVVFISNFKLILEA
jgi:hypothetical protein